MWNLKKYNDFCDEVSSIFVFSLIFCMILAVAAVKYTAIVAFVVKFFSLE